jgi:hypothetical protein
MVKSREYYISKCRYYDGDDIMNAPADKINFAEYEAIWVRANLDDIDFLRDCAKVYKDWGLVDFNPDDGVPITLKALLLTRFIHWGSGHETPDDFKKWYTEQYL